MSIDWANENIELLEYILQSLAIFKITFVIILAQNIKDNKPYTISLKYKNFRDIFEKV